VRVRVGELVAECAAGEAERLELERGRRAFLVFPPERARLVDTAGPGTSAPADVAT
jgi:hypothetical protein